MKAYFLPSNIFLFISVLCLPVIFFSTVQDGVLLSRILVLNLLAIASNIYLWLNYTKLKDQINSVLSHKILLAYFAFAIAHFIALPSSFNIVDAVYECCKVVVYLNTLIIAAVFFKQEVIRERLHYALLALTFLLGAIALYQYFKLDDGYQDDFLSLWAGLKIEGFFANKNIFAQVCILLLPLLVSGILKIKNTWFKRLSIVGIVSLLVLIIILKSKAVILVFICYLLVIPLILYVSQLKIDFTSSKKRTNWISATVLTLFFICFLSVYLIHISRNMGKKELLTEVFTDEIIDTYHPESTLIERTLMYRNTIKMIADNPVVGIGPGNWNIFFPKYKVGGTELINRGELLFQRPHNDFLLVFSEMGIIGFLAYFLVFAFTVGVLINNIRKANGLDRIIYVLLVSGVIGYAIISIFSFPKERVFPHFLFLIYLALIISISGTKTQAKISYLNRFVFMLLFISSVLTCWLGYKRYKNERLMYEVTISSFKKNWEDVAIRTQAIDQNFLVLDELGVPVDWHTGRAYFYLGDIDKALYFYKRAKEKNPYNCNVLNDLATCYELKGDHDLARFYYTASLNIIPRAPLVRLNLASTYYNQGDYDKAFEVFSKINSVKMLKGEKYKKAFLTIYKAKISNDLSPLKSSKTQQKWEQVLHQDERLFELFLKSVATNTDFSQLVERELVS